jgi:hypothetical protein
VRKHLFDLAVLFVLASAVTAYVALSQPSLRNTTLRIYVFVLGALVMLALVTAAREAAPIRGRSEFERALAERQAPRQRVPELEKLEREVTLATAAEFDLHVRLLPQLREIAQARLERSGRTLDAETAGRWWDLLRPDRPQPAERFSPGITAGELRELVAHLERM